MNATLTFTVSTKGTSVTFSAVYGHPKAYRAAHMAAIKARRRLTAALGIEPKRGEIVEDLQGAAVRLVYTYDDEFGMKPVISKCLKEFASDLEMELTAASAPDATPTEE